MKWEVKPVEPPTGLTHFAGMNGCKIPQTTFWFLQGRFGMLLPITLMHLRSEINSIIATMIDIETADGASGLIRKCLWQKSKLCKNIIKI